MTDKAPRPNRQDRLKQVCPSNLLGYFVGAGNFVTVPKIFVQLTGDYAAAVLLGEIAHYSTITSDPSGFFYKTQKEWKEELGLTHDRLERCLNGSKTTKGLLSLGVEREFKKPKHDNWQADYPVWHYRINWAVLTESLNSVIRDSRTTEIAYYANHVPPMDIRDSRTHTSLNESLLKENVSVPETSPLKAETIETPQSEVVLPAFDSLPRLRLAGNSLSDTQWKVMAWVTETRATKVTVAEFSAKTLEAMTKEKAKFCLRGIPNHPGQYFVDRILVREEADKPSDGTRQNDLAAVWGEVMAQGQGKENFFIWRGIVSKLVGLSEVTPDLLQTCLQWHWKDTEDTPKYRVATADGLVNLWARWLSQNRPTVVEEQETLLGIPIAKLKQAVK